MGIFVGGILLPGGHHSALNYHIEGVSNDFWWPEMMMMVQTSVNCSENLRQVEV